MKLHRYRNVFVFPGVYVNSLCQYSFRASVIEYGGEFSEVFVRRRKVDYSPSFGCDPQMPKYVEREIERQIIAMHDAGELKFHEYDQEGTARWENLRYYDADEWASLVDMLRREAAR